MTLTSKRSPDENKIDVDPILHTNGISSDEQSTSTNNPGNIGLNADDMVVLQESEVGLQNEIFEDDRDGFGDDDNSGQTDTTGQHI